MLDFFRNNSLVIAIVGSLASVISIPLNAILYVISLHQPSIAYSTGQIKIYDASSKFSALTITGPNGERIDADVYAYEIILWNSGSAPLDGSLVRQFPQIEFPGAKSIIAAQAPLASRYVDPKVALDDQSKSASISWEHLDPGAGIKLTLIYSSNGIIEPTINSDIVGVSLSRYSSVSPLGARANLPAQHGDPRSLITIFGVELWLLLLLSFAVKLVVRTAWYQNLRNRRQSKRRERVPGKPSMWWSRIVLTLFGLFAMSVMLFAIYNVVIDYFGLGPPPL